jgi:hypothetical protein
MKRSLSPNVIALALLAALQGASGSCALAEEKSYFADKVAPVLRQRCVRCHNGQKPRGSLDLTNREHLLTGGEHGPAIMPGKAAKSLLMRMVSGPKPRMPKQGEPLTNQEVADLGKWIDDGAPWPKGVILAAPGRKPIVGPDWWSLRPLARPEIPMVKNKTWGRTLIDAFILAKLEAAGMKPAPEADPATLVRRVTFDLHGLPPTPQEIDNFVNDKSPDAYEKLIDRLLASPHYGERWGLHWLDVVHYGDTHGYDKDKRRDQAWPYRDYVIGAFNADKPYTRFIKEQLAGDVLYPDDPDGVIATGFVVAGPWDFVGHVELREGTVDKEKTRLIDRDDMVANTISTFQSLTAHCARCHDHKFDRIPQKDYYRLQAVFAGVERGNRSYASKEVMALRAPVEKQRNAVSARRAALEKKVEALTRPELTRVNGELKKVTAELTALPAPAGSPSPTNGYHSAIAAKPDVQKWVQVDLGKPMALDEIRLIPARPTDFPDTPGFGFPVRFQIAVSDDAGFVKAEVVADHAKADFTNPKDKPFVVRLKNRKARYIRVTATRLWPRSNDYVFAMAELQAQSGGKNVALGATVTALDSIEAGRWGRKNLVDGHDSRRALASPSDPEAVAAAETRRLLAKRLRQLLARRQEVIQSLLDDSTRSALARTAADLAVLDKRLQSLPALDAVYAVVPIPPRPIHVLNRGGVEQRGDLVSPGALSCVRGPDADFKLTRPEVEGNRRAALAEWIADPKNVLTWRSIVNRVWHYHFGKGIVDTPNDFGGNGSKPTHPELLDWLAVEFRDSGGSFKKLHRLILLSSVYRQSSRHHAGYAKIDGDNRLLWRMHRQRLDAEEIRDAVLAVSGRLNLKMGGPGFELFRFKDDHSPVYDHSALERIHDPKTYRRTVYRFTVRSVPNPFLECLDCADPNINTPVRNTTLTALQALALLNDPFMVRQAEHFAARLKQSSDDPGKQIDMAFRLAFGRLPSVEERPAVCGYARKHGLANTCRLLFNANEFVFID